MPAIRTRRQVAQNSATTDINDAITQANSIGPCVRNWISCEETGGSITQLTDIAKNAVIIDSGSGAPNAEISSVIPYALRLFLDQSPDTTEYAWDTPGTSDNMIMVVGTPRFDNTVNGDEDFGGTIEFLIGYFTSGDAQLRVQPYYASWVEQSFQIATEYDPTRADLQSGETYVFAAIRHGNTLEHWRDGVKTSEVDMVSLMDECSLDDSLWLNWDSMPAVTRTGHSAYGEAVISTTAKANLCWGYPITGTSNVQYPGNFSASGGHNGAVANLSQDIYGMVHFVFTNGTPGDVGTAMVWMRDQWASGNKVIWPGWSTLL